MSRIVRCSALSALGLAGALATFAILDLGPAQASTPRAYGSACASPASVASYKRLGCRLVRTTRRHVRTYRPMIADARLPLIDPGLYGVSRYVSLLILGVGF